MRPAVDPVRFPWTLWATPWSPWTRSPETCYIMDRRTVGPVSARLRSLSERATGHRLQASDKRLCFCRCMARNLTIVPRSEVLDPASAHTTCCPRAAHSWVMRLMCPQPSWPMFAWTLTCLGQIWLEFD